MIAPTMPLPAFPVAQSGRQVLRLSDDFRNDASQQLALALDGISGKRIRAANIPGAGVTFLSRAQNGIDCNPLYRIVSVFVLMKRLGMDRARAQRLVDWLQEIVDLLWGPATDEAADINDVLDKDKELDALDEVPQQRAVRGDVAATRELILIKGRQRAHARTVIMALRHRLLSLTEQ